jgi:glycosyltransferase involved in cell wall biosynthesis
MRGKTVTALVIAPQPFFSPRGTPFSVYYRTLVTAELGVSIDLLTYGEGMDVDIPGVRIIRIPQFSLLGNVKTGPSILKLFLDIFMVIWTIALLVRNKYDFVHAHEEAIFYCRFLKPLFRFKLVYDMHSSLPQQLTNFQFTTSKFISGLFQKLEDTCLRRADAVITICPDLADYATKRMRDKEKHFLIENSIFEPVKLRVNGDNPAVSASGNVEDISVNLPDGKKIVVYTGTFEHYQGIEILICAFTKVIEEHPDAFLLIVGGTPGQVKHYSRIAFTAGLDEHCIITGRVNQRIARYYRSLASVLVSPRSSGTNTPLKIYELLASGIPLVATNVCSHTQILDVNVAYLVSPDSDDMARGINAALSPAGRQEHIVKNARRLYEEKYSRKRYEHKMKGLLDLLSC